jgi:D-sedoheptulose 7-phosphate isomerase
MLHSQECIKAVKQSIDLICKTYNNSGKILFCGNGGSAADCEHLAGELSGRFILDRRPLNAEALHTSGSALTAISNDYSYEQAYARLLEAKANNADVLIAISTSGQSSNVINAIAKARVLDLKIITISGQDAADFHKHSDISIIIPSDNTARIQEAYMLLGHIICEHVEQNLFGS